MSPMAPLVKVLWGGAAPASAPRSQLWTAYEHYWLGRQVDLVSEKTLETYVTHVEPFRTWAGEECGARRFADLDIATVRAYRAREATRTGKHGRRLSPFMVLDSHKAPLTFFRWAKTEGYEFDGRILDGVLAFGGLAPPGGGGGREIVVAFAETVSARRPPNGYDVRRL